MAIHWAAPMLAQLLPTKLMDRISEAQVDPFRPAPDKDFVPLLNGKTGEMLLEVPLPKAYRVTRSRMRKLCSEGIDIHVGVFGVRCQLLQTDAMAVQQEAGQHRRVAERSFGDCHLR